MRPLPHRKVERTLRRHGFVLRGMRGSHGKWAHPDGRLAMVPRHTKEIPRGTLRAIADQSHIPISEFG